MKNFAITVALLICAAKFGMDYISSEKFQAYGDRTGAQWTCEVNLIIAHIHNLFSHYKAETFYLKKIVQRCPDTTAADEATFDLARSLESQGLRSDAVTAYETYAERFPGTKRARLATKSANMLRTTQ